MIAKEDGRACCEAAKGHRRRLPDPFEGSADASDGDFVFRVPASPGRGNRVVEPRRREGTKK